MLSIHYALNFLPEEKGADVIVRSYMYLDSEKTSVLVNTRTVPS